MIARLRAAPCPCLNALDAHYTQTLAIYTPSYTFLWLSAG